MAPTQLSRKPQILICDDDSLYHLALKTALKGAYECRSAYNTDEAFVILKNNTIDILLLDVQMRTPQEGLENLPRLKALDPDLAVIMISGITDFQTVREAMRLGAVDYIPKDFNPSELRHTLDQALERNKLLKQRDQQNFEVSIEQKKHILIGESDSIKTLRKMIEKFRASDANVLITGETGTGKEVVARQLRGNLPDGSLAPFVAIDSATIQSTTAESILFGHEKGAFTGAEKSNKGVFEEANGGIVYFDELGNMPLEIQAKLLRVLQEKEVTRLGSTKAIQLDFRVVCATNRNLDEMVKQGQFKDDLVQRLNVLPITVPPLRERKEDIPLLANHFLKKSEKLHGALDMSEDAIELLKNYRWPGNIRELANVIAFTVTMAESETIEAADLPPKLRDLVQNQLTGNLSGQNILDESSHGTGNQKFYEQVAAFEKNILAAAYKQLEGNVSKLALHLGMDRSHLYTKLREYQIHNAKSK